MTTLQLILCTIAGVGNLRPMGHLRPELTTYIAHSNRVWPILDLKIEIWPSGTKRLPTPDIRYAPV